MFGGLVKIKKRQNSGIDIVSHFFWIQIEAKDSSKRFFTASKNNVPSSRYSRIQSCCKLEEKVSTYVDGRWYVRGQKKHLWRSKLELVCQFLISHITKLHITKLLYLSIPKPSLCFFGLRPKKQGMVIKTWIVQKYRNVKLPTELSGLSFQYVPQLWAC